MIGAVFMPLAIWLAPVSTIPATTTSRLPAVLVTPTAAAGSSWPSASTLWLAGACAVLLQLVRAHAAAWRLARSAMPIGDGVYRADVRAPITVGIVRPRILLPIDAEPTQAVLLHERAHIARRDLLVQLACAMYWWNPLAWIAAGRLRVEREHACDDAVLAAGVLPSSYATAILALGHHRVPAGAGMSDASLTARVERILDARASRRSPRVGARIALTALTGASVVMLACSSARPASVAPASRGMLSFGAPSVRGPGPLAPPTMFREVQTRPTIDLARVAEEVQRRAGTLEQCYQRRLTERPSLAGTVEIHWVIEESGRVLDACVTKDTVQDRELVECVNALVMEPFPGTTRGTVDVSVPFVFAARS